MRYDLKSLINSFLGLCVVYLLGACAEKGPSEPTEEFISTLAAIENEWSSRPSPTDPTLLSSDTEQGSVGTKRSAFNKIPKQRPSPVRSVPQSSKLSLRTKTASGKADSPDLRKLKAIFERLRNELGTGDVGGGGNGIDGKVYESFHVLPFELPAYKLHITKILNNIVPESHNDSAPYYLMLLPKIWYIAPVKLNTLSKEALGVTFIDSEPEQFARQTMQDVWINKDVWDGMLIPSDDLATATKFQAEFLLHELVENLYLVKFFKITEICTLGMLYSDRGDCKNPENVDEFLPPEKVRKLNDKDYDNIRFVTNWLLKNGHRKIKASTLNLLLASKGFDRRFFGGPTNAEINNLSKKDLLISYREFLWALPGLQNNEVKSARCYGMTSGKTVPCGVKATPQHIEMTPPVRVPGYNLHIEIGGRTVDLKLLLALEQNLGAHREQNGQRLYFHSTQEVKPAIRYGDRLSVVNYLFSKQTLSETAPIILEAIIVKPGQVVFTDKIHEPHCKLKSPDVQDLTDEVLIIQFDSAPSDLVSSALQPLSLSPYASCSSSAIIDEDPAALFTETHSKSPSPGSPPRWIDFKLSPKPGLITGQTFSLESPLLLATKSEPLGLFYFDGEVVSESQLKTQDGQSYCWVALRSAGAPPYDKELILPKNTKISLVDLAFYEPSVIFDVVDGPFKNASGILECGVVNPGNLEDQRQTSLAAIEKSFKGILSLKKVPSK